MFRKSENNGIKVIMNNLLEYNFLFSDYRIKRYPRIDCLTSPQLCGLFDFFLLSMVVINGLVSGWRTDVTLT